MREGVVDLLLDRAVVPGYSRIGYHLRRWHWDALPPDALLGRTVLVTGGTSGLGLATALGCARLGATVHVLGRDRGRGEQAASAVRDAVPRAKVEVVPSPQATVTVWASSVPASVYVPVTAVVSPSSIGSTVTPTPDKTGAALATGTDTVAAPVPPSLSVAVSVTA